MGNEINEMAVDSGMCPHGNFPATCEQCGQERQKEQLTPEEIESIENSSLGIASKVELLLVKAGAKPAAELYLQSDRWHQGQYDTSKHVDPEKVKEAIKLLDDFGLPKGETDTTVTNVVRGDEFDESQQITFKREVVMIPFAKDDETLKRYKQALQDNSGEKFGEVYGYPPTSVEAFLGKRERMDAEEFPPEVKQQDLYPFTQFVFSKDNWREEIKTAEHWAQVVKKNSPKIFEEYKKAMAR